MRKRTIATGAAGIALLGTAIVSSVGWWHEHQQARLLESQLQSLREESKRAAVVQSVSRQMEEIAREQKDISDEQREEAIQQRRTAEEMRQRSEVERQNALLAQQQAQQSAAQAQEARQLAESQRQFADHQRLQAEMSKRVTDTLSFLALGRSLGSQATFQFQSGNTDLARLLSYASYLFTRRYGGDVFYPAVYQALTLTSQSVRTWALHAGAVSCIAFMPKGDDRMVTSSTYGGLMLHRQKANGELVNTVLIRNSQYDFRDIFIGANGIIYAVSRSGHLVMTSADNNKPVILMLSKVEHPIGISQLDNEHLLIVGEHDLAVLDMKRNTIGEYRHLDYQVRLVARSNYKPLLFDNKGRMHSVTNLNSMQTRKVPIDGLVTAYAESKGTGAVAYGMSDGTIYLSTADGKTNRLVGHQSRISRLKINGRTLYSSSYDGTLNQWTVSSAKIEPVTLFNRSQWVMNFTFDNSKQSLWVGDWGGNLATTLMNATTVAERLRSQLKRNLTADEWAYYIGRNVPYEAFIGKEAAP